MFNLILKMCYIAVVLWIVYAFSLGLANDICDCVKEFDGWWRVF